MKINKDKHVFSLTQSQSALRVNCGKSCSWTFPEVLHTGCVSGFNKAYSELSVFTAMFLCSSLLCGSGLIFLAVSHFLHRPDVANSILVALCVQTKEKNTSSKFASKSKPQEACLMQQSLGIWCATFLKRHNGHRRC